MPFVNLVDSGGLRFQEGMDAMQAYGYLFRALGLASGIIPQIAVLMGPCLGGQGYMPVMQDFLIQVKDTGFLAIAGPAVIKSSISEEIALEELAGWRTQAGKTGNTHVVAENEKDALEKAKELLSFFPSNNRQKPPCIGTSDKPERLSPDLDKLIPDNIYQPYDMHELLEEVVDDGHFFEIMKDFARNVIVGFARFNGRPVGIVASQPMVKAGVLDVDSSDKAARFIRFCDLFNIPLISFLDSPAMMVGSEEEYKGVLRHGTKLLFAWSNATVPLIAIMVRKMNGGGYHCMLHRGMGADFAFAWPTATFFGTGSAAAASIIYGKEIRDAENPEELRKKREREFEEYWSNPYRAAERGYVDDIIMPHDTRKIINMALDSLENKVVARPWKKYDNITL
jgi:acetyl-CoA carboxylase carboxyltransferase component